MTTEGIIFIIFIIYDLLHSEEMMSHIKRYINTGLKYLVKKEYMTILYGLALVSILRIDKYIDDIKYGIMRLNRKNGNYPIIKINDYYMHINLEDKGISKQLGIHKKRECFSTEFMKNIIREDWTIIDIGANIGYYALLEAQLANLGQVYAIEPVSKSLELTRKNVSLNNFQNISLFNIAIGDMECNANMYICDKCNLSSFLKNPGANIICEIESPMTTLDKFFENHVRESPDFIRMDVEGYEFQIIKGAQKILGGIRPLILCIELHPHLMNPKNMEELVKTLKDNYFKIRAIFVESQNYYGVSMISKLRAKIGLYEFGFQGSSYEDLYNVLKNNQASIVFFEKNIKNIKGDKICQN